MAVLPEERVLTTLHTVALAVQVLQRMGVATERVLDGSGVRAEDLETPTRLISHAQELRVLANALAASADPALNPNQPNHSNPTPSSTKGRLCGRMASFLKPIRGPRTRASARAEAPETISTTSPPA